MMHQISTCAKQASLSNTVNNITIKKIHIIQQIVQKEIILHKELIHYIIV
jgi:hypothetical protein